MKPENFVLELESLCEQSGYQIRKERGSFRGDHCVVEGEKLIIINKNKPIELQAGVLANVLRGNSLEDIYIKPAVRKELSNLWDRLDQQMNNHPDETDV
ncbi:MAG: hypothetical protein WD315_02365 [Balneolaceae bacterium]